eukprot:TRINITY_DN38137_c0_g1_i1.p1 TRINITY_DN38137_c0_g1~~TRINITY_DN38137_c0_g1_i1.p1  ORF type:complete len:837 (+),score=126.31 TRINITY_DN38137_c0_g1_i1:54-2564(+)
MNRDSKGLRFTVLARSRDLYSVLGVAPSVSSVELRTAYRRQALRCHPDKGGTTEAFRQVLQAFEVLSSARARAKYDDARFASERGEVLRRRSHRGASRNSDVGCASCANSGVGHSTVHNKQFSAAAGHASASARAHVTETKFTNAGRPSNASTSAPARSPPIGSSRPPPPPPPISPRGSLHQPAVDKPKATIPRASVHPAAGAGLVQGEETAGNSSKQNEKEKKRFVGRAPAREVFSKKHHGTNGANKCGARFGFGFSEADSEAGVKATVKAGVPQRKPFRRRMAAPGAAQTTADGDGAATGDEGDDNVAPLSKLTVSLVRMRRLAALMQRNQREVALSGLSAHLKDQFLNFMVMYGKDGLPRGISYWGRRLCRRRRESFRGKTVRATVQDEPCVPLCGRDSCGGGSAGKSASISLLADQPLAVGATPAAIGEGCEGTSTQEVDGDNHQACVSLSAAEGATVGSDDLSSDSHGSSGEFALSNGESHEDIGAILDQDSDSFSTECLALGDVEVHVVHQQKEEGTVRNPEPPRYPRRTRQQNTSTGYVGVTRRVDTRTQHVSYQAFVSVGCISVRSRYTKTLETAIDFHIVLVQVRESVVEAVEETTRDDDLFRKTLQHAVDARCADMNDMSVAFSVCIRAFGVKVRIPSTNSLSEVLDQRSLLLEARELGYEKMKHAWASLLQATRTNVYKKSRTWSAAEAQLYVEQEMGQGDKRRRRRRTINEVIEERELRKQARAKVAESRAKRRFDRVWLGWLRVAARAERIVAIATCASSQAARRLRRRRAAAERRRRAFEKMRQRAIQREKDRKHAKLTSWAVQKHLTMADLERMKHSRLRR